MTFQGGTASTETLRDSTLERLHVTYAFTGDWDDIRQLIYEIETGPDFIVIDNVQLAEGSQANAPLTLTLELSTYYRDRAMSLDRRQLMLGSGSRHRARPRGVDVVAVDAGADGAGANGDPRAQRAGRCRRLRPGRSGRCGSRR